MMDRTTVVGVFDGRAMAERAIDDLHRLGFHDDQIGLVMRGEDHTHVTDDNGNRAGEGGATGMVAGGVIGGALALASLAIPGVGPVLAAGIASTIIGGAAAGGAIGGIVGLLAGMGVPDDEAHYYEGEFNRGRVLVTVRAGDRAIEARDVLRHAGAYDMETRRAA